MLEQEGELAGLADAVEVAVDLVVLAACRRRKTQTAVSRHSQTLYLFIYLFRRPTGRETTEQQTELDHGAYFWTRGRFFFFFFFFHKSDDATKEGSGFKVLLYVHVGGILDQSSVTLSESRLPCTRPVELFYYTDMLYSIRNLHE